MKKSVFLLILLNVSIAQSQKIYTVPYSYMADLNVFVTNKDYKADLNVYKVSKPYEVKNNSGLWFFTNKKYDSDKKIFFCDYEYQADLKIFFVKKNIRQSGRTLKKNTYYFNSY